MSNRNKMQMTSTDALLGNPGSNVLPILMSFFVGQGAISFGYHMAVTSPAADFLLGEMNINNDKNKRNLAFSLVCLGAIVGSLISGSLADRIGRRRALMLTSLPFFGGVFLMAYWISLPGIALGRLLSGVGVGAVSVLVPMYISEIAPTALRGSLGVINQLSITIGVLLALALGLLFDNNNGLYWWRLLLFVSLAPAAGLVVAAFFGPESPHWLLNNGQREAAVASLFRLRQSSLQAVEDELNELSATSDGDNSTPVEAGWADLCGPVAWRPVLLGIGLMLSQQWSGVNGVLFNINNLAGPTGAVAFAASQTGCTLLASLVMEKAGRRTFLMGSAFVMFASCIVFGYALKANLSSAFKVGAALVYIAAFSFGLGPLPWLICTELYPARVRTKAVSLSTVVNWSSAFLITLTFANMSDTLGQDGVLYFYGGVCFAATLFVLFLVPETRGKTLDEVEQMFINHVQDGGSRV